MADGLYKASRVRTIDWIENHFQALPSVRASSYWEGWASSPTKTCAAPQSSNAFFCEIAGQCNGVALTKFVI